MKLRFGKDDWLDLEPVPLRSQVEEGVRSFVLAGPVRAASPVARAATSRAAVAADRVMRQAFQKSSSLFASPEQRKEADAKADETAMFRDRAGRLRMVYREVVLRFARNTTSKQRKALLDKYGLSVRTRNNFNKDQLIAFDPKRKYVAERMVELANELTETEEVLFAFPNFVSEFKRDLQSPSPVKEQWHLGLVDAPKAWSVSQGNGIVVAVLDDGVDVEHPNLKRNIKHNPDPAEPRDETGRDFFVSEDAPDHFNPRPKLFRSPFNQMKGNDIHGTCCAGVIAAAGNGNVFGVAPKAQILPVKIFHADDLATESHVANAIRYASRFADILSCSWNGPRSLDIEFAIGEAGGGRGGKGCPVFCATGNNKGPVSFPAVLNVSIAVGASTDKEDLAWYSNRGPEVSVVAPSGGGKNGILTTDVSLENRGFNVGSAAAGGADGQSFNAFTGTSSATPLAAGVAALMLAANPKLTRDEVRSLLQDTAKKIGPATGYDAKGHSDEFGFGRIDAASAVDAALKAAAAARLSDVPAKKKPSAGRKTSAKKTAAKPAAAKKAGKKTAARKTSAARQGAARKRARR